MTLSLALLGVPPVFAQDEGANPRPQPEVQEGAPELVLSAREVTPGKALMGARIADERGQPVGTIEDLLIDQKGRLCVALVRPVTPPAAADGSHPERTPPADGASIHDPLNPRGTLAADDTEASDAMQSLLVGVPVAALQFQHPLRGSSEESAQDKPHRSVSGVLSLAERLADAPVADLEGTPDGDWIEAVHGHFTVPVPEGLVAALQSRDRATQADEAVPQEPVLIACSELIGSSVQNTTATLGTVADLALDLRDGELLYAIVRSDRLLGLDHQLRPLAIDTRQVDLEQDVVHVSVSQAAFDEREPLDEAVWAVEREQDDKQG